MASTAAVNTSEKVVTRVAEKVADTDFVPTVVETAEVALKLPSKFVVSSKLVVGVVAGAAIGAGAVYGVQKYRQRRALKKVVVA